MQKIPISLAAPGMVLAKAILRENGQVLVGEGTELSESLVNRLGSMKVDAITVQGHPVNMEGVGGGTSFATRIERLDHLFRKHQADPWMNKVKAHMHQYFTMKAAAEEAAAKAAEEEAARKAEEAEASEQAEEQAPQEDAGNAADSKKGGLLRRIFKGGGRG